MSFHSVDTMKREYFLSATSIVFGLSLMVSCVRLFNNEKKSKKYTKTVTLTLKAIKSIS